MYWMLWNKWAAEAKEEAQLKGFNTFIWGITDTGTMISKDKKVKHKNVVTPWKKSIHYKQWKIEELKLEEMEVLI